MTMYEKSKTLSSILGGVNDALHGATGLNLGEYKERSKTGGFKGELAQDVFGKDYVSTEEYKRRLKNGVKGDKTYQDKIAKIQAYKDNINKFKKIKNKLKLKEKKEKDLLRRGAIDKATYDTRRENDKTYLDFIRPENNHSEIKQLQKDIKQMKKDYINKVKQYKNNERGYTGAELLQLKKLQLAEEELKKKNTGGTNGTTYHPKNELISKIVNNDLKKFGKKDLDTQITTYPDWMEKYRAALELELTDKNKAGTIDLNNPYATASYSRFKNIITTSASNVQTELNNSKDLEAPQASVGGKALALYDWTSMTVPKRDKNGDLEKDKDGKIIMTTITNHNDNKKKEGGERLLNTQILQKVFDQPDMIKDFSVLKNGKYNKPNPNKSKYSKMNNALASAVRLHNAILSSPLPDDDKKYLIKTLGEQFISNVTK